MLSFEYSGLEASVGYSAVHGTLHLQLSAPRRHSGQGSVPTGKGRLLGSLLWDSIPVRVAGRKLLEQKLSLRSSHT